MVSSFKTGKSENKVQSSGLSYSLSNFHAMQVKVVSCLDRQWNPNLLDAFESTFSCFTSASAAAKTRYPQSDVQTKFLNSTTNLSPITLLVADFLPNAHLPPLKINPMHRKVNCPFHTIPLSVYTGATRQIICIPILGLDTPWCWTNCNLKGLAMI